MGITGLLPIFKPAFRRSHIKSYTGKRIGIDGHAWLHQILPSIAVELYEKRETERHTHLFLAKVRALEKHGIVPVVVFDGDYLPSKEKTAILRRETKEKYRREVEFYIRHNQIPRAREYMKRCVSVTPEVLLSILKVLVANRIEYIISPYEADAQLYYLQSIGYIDYILTEDSDLIVYGADKILYKYDGEHAHEYRTENRHKCMDAFFSDNLMTICILSGCDYLSSIRGVGISTAYKKLKECGDVLKFVESMILSNKDVPADYLREFMRAKRTFLHHIVYDPVDRQRVYLQQPDKHYEYLGTLDAVDVVHQSHLGTEVKYSRHFTPLKLSDAVVIRTQIEGDSENRVNSSYPSKF